ncbi:hypothetical protein DACRYDRAFT_117410 [Dacryopinax primogenitus]|uniref:Dbl homology domain-containing protein n=1 Tax=Dacryopinax primogenitus (strain DJM 731) TaxID=1858805 RepID=M5FXE4_DACPD|nr:uncharacterized protein DACRYDRAFT_117410 [Dacryopinax primogenitus]EJU00455.1 hypothetical protein DACRYDRAFT_117410 [Dacryopinax primogenitus]
MFLSSIPPPVPDRPHSHTPPHLTVQQIQDRPLPQAPESPSTTELPIYTPVARPHERTITPGSSLSIPTQPTQPQLRTCHSWAALPRYSTYDDSSPSASAWHSWSASNGSDTDSFIQRSSESSVDTFVASELLQHRQFEEDAIQRFQASQLPSDEEWHHLVPRAALSSLPKKEVQRQSIIFEIIKSERDYVSDLAAVEDVYIATLRSSPILAQQAHPFLLEVFSNLPAIRAQHDVLLSRLFERQRSQHPYTLSIADIILDSSLRSTSAYETYIKHYPLAEARHRRELQINPAYASLLEAFSDDPRIRKRDVITFLSRPVTRLPRLALLLENMLQHTEPSHPDAQDAELILSVLRSFVRSTQPGIAASDAKVRFWTLCETLVFRKGELMDLDLYDQKRTLVHSGHLGRKNTQWVDLHVALLDNYMLLTQQEPHLGKHVVVSRPLPLQYLRLGSFTDPPESRLFNWHAPDSFSTSRDQIWPFTVYHVADRAQRRYTLYAETEEKRQQWHDALVDALGVMSVQQESNRWFATNALSKAFRLQGKVPKVKLPGPIVCAASFTLGKEIVLVACANSVWVGFRGDGKSYRKALKLSHVTNMAVLPHSDHLLILYDEQLVSYSLTNIARFLAGDGQALTSRPERVSLRDEHVSFFAVGGMEGRRVVVYAARRSVKKMFIALQLSDTGTPVNTGEEWDRRSLEAVKGKRKDSEDEREDKDDKKGRSKHFVPYGSPFYAKDAYDFAILQKKIAVCTDKGMTIYDPAAPDAAPGLVVPDLLHVSGDKALAALKQRCESSKPLGLVRSGETELLVVFDHFGCYVNMRREPARHGTFVRWEIHAQRVVFRQPHLLLFDHTGDYLEVRDVGTGRLEQVIEGQNIRLLGDISGGPVLLAKRGESVDGVVQDVLTELVQTQSLAPQRPIWDERGLW